MQIFLDDTDYRRFVFLMADVVEEFEIECWNYCLMPNHYHATLRPLRPNLSEAMQKLNGGYAQWWNRRHERVGHVFQGPFKQQLVQRDAHLLVLCRYVAMNPVRAQLVAHPADWPWSSFRATIGLERAPAFLDVDSVLRQFGEDATEVLQQRFADFVTQDSAQDAGLIDRIRSNEAVLGDRVFKMSLRETLPAIQAGKLGSETVS